MNRFSIRARLKEAFKVAQPLPHLTDLLSASSCVNHSPQVVALESLTELLAMTAAMARGLGPFHNAKDLARH